MNNGLKRNWNELSQPVLGYHKHLIRRTEKKYKESQNSWLSEQDSSPRPSCYDRIANKCVTTFYFGFGLASVLDQVCFATLATASINYYRNALVFYP